MIIDNVNKEVAVRSRASIVWLILGILFIAVNLRAPIIGLGPLVGYIHSQTHLSNTITGLLSALPLLAFAILSRLHPK
ncbi:hypothetical protein ACLBWT_17050 [Paenibacillus sp. D51F]